MWYNIHVRLFSFRIVLLLLQANSPTNNGSQILRRLVLVQGRMGAVTSTPPYSKSKLNCVILWTKLKDFKYGFEFWCEKNIHMKKKRVNVMRLYPLNRTAFRNKKIVFPTVLFWTWTDMQVWWNSSILRHQKRLNHAISTDFTFWHTFACHIHVYGCDRRRLGLHKNSRLGAKHPFFN